MGFPWFCIQSILDEFHNMEVESSVESSQIKNGQLLWNQSEIERALAIAHIQICCNHLR